MKFLSEGPQLWIVTVTWRFLHGACEMIHIFVCKEKTGFIVLKVSGVSVQKFSCQCAWHLCTPEVDD